MAFNHQYLAFAKFWPGEKFNECLCGIMYHTFVFNYLYLILK